MSTLLVANSNAAIFAVNLGMGHGFNDDRLQRSDYKTMGGDFVSSTPMVNQDILWPRSQGLSGVAESQIPLLNPDAAAQAWEWNVWTTGHHHRMVLTGQTLNSAGAATGGVTVKLYNTITGLLVDTQVSDTGGNFSVTDPNNVACFMVAYLAGSPDICGTSIDELIGS